jgi:hypothetical protein
MARVQLLLLWENVEVGVEADESRPDDTACGRESVKMLHPFSVETLANQTSGCSNEEVAY